MARLRVAQGGFERPDALERAVALRLEPGLDRQGGVLLRELVRGPGLGGGGPRRAVRAQAKLRLLERATQGEILGAE